MQTSGSVLRDRAPVASCRRPPSLARARAGAAVAGANAARARRAAAAATVARASSSSSSSSSDNSTTANNTSSPPSPAERGGRRAAIACGCAACAFAVLGAAAASSRPAAASSSDLLSRPRGGAYDAYFAKAMGTMQVYEGEVAGLKRQLFVELARDLFADNKNKNQNKAPVATILELGVGRGPNFAVLAEAVRDAGGDVSRGDVRVVGVDPNPEMLPYAREAADAAGFPRESVELRALYGEQLEEAFGGEGGSKFDAAVVTLVLCSVPDVPTTLAQLRAVVKQGGKGGGEEEGGQQQQGGGRLLLIEHVRDPNARSLRRLGQTLLNPLQRALADGCNLTRDTEGELRRAGLLDGNEARLRRLEVDGLGLLAPHLAGVLEL